MNLKKQNAIFSILLIFSILFGNLSFQGQDIVSSDDIWGGGSSVFVFRHSKTKPQFKSHSDKYFVRNISGRGITSRLQTRKKINFNSRLAKKAQPKRNNSAVSKRDLSDTLTAQANNLLKNKSTDKAILTYQEALKRNPNNQNARLGLSRAFAAKGDEIFQQTRVEDSKSVDEAVVNYEKALAINPDFPGLSMQVANLNYQKGEISKAEDYLSRAEKTSGGNAETELLRGLIHLKQYNNQAALADFIRSTKLAPKNPEAYFYKAETYDRLDRKEEALKTYRETLELDPKFTEAWFDLAVLNYNLGEYQEAISLYHQVIALDKNHPDAHANLASAYRQLEKYSEANGEYKIAAEYLKNDPDLFSEWGFCLGQVTEWDKAIMRLNTAKDLSPQAIDYTNLGWAYLNAAQKDSASRNQLNANTKLNLGKAALQKAIELNPGLDAAFLNLGMTYAGLGEYQNAINTLNQANNLRQKWVAGLNALGLAYRKFNKYSEAISQFQKAINLDEKFAPAYFNLGEAQLRSGKKKDAGRTLEKLKQLDPSLAKKLEDIMNGPVIEREE